MNMMKMYTKDREFNYEQPRMSYDKATGDVTILAKDKGPKKKIIRSLDDYEKEKLALMRKSALKNYLQPVTALFLTRRCLRMRWTRM